MGDEDNDFWNNPWWDDNMSVSDNGSICSSNNGSICSSNSVSSGLHCLDCVNCETTNCSNCEKDAICNKCINCRGCRVRRCDTNLTSNTPAVKMQIQKIIQNVVRVPSSLYTMNLGALTSYRNPHVNWNRMSDRGQASVQKTYVPGGGGLVGGNSTRSALTRCRPGAMSPGGVGCDIKHNSYARHLNRLKGRGPLRRGIPSPLGSGAPPMTGAKVVNYGIVAGCDCSPM